MQLENPAKSWYLDKWFWSVMAFSILLLVPILLEPLAFDNAINESLAVDFLHYGRIPYLQSFDHNFPGIIFIHCAEILLFGSSDLGFRIFDVLIQLAFAGFFYRLLLRWLDRRNALLATVLYILWYVSAGSGVYGQRDVFIGILFYIGVALVLRGNSFYRVIFSGLIFGITFLIRPTSLLLIVLFAVYLYVNEDIHLNRSYLWRVVTFLFSALIPSAFFVLYMSQYQGGLKAMYEATILFNIDVHVHQPTPSHPLWEIIRASPLLFFGILGFFASSKKFAFYPSKRIRYLYGLSVLATLAIVMVQQKYFRYHFAPFFMLLIPSAAIGISILTSKINNVIRRHYAVIISLALCSFIRFNPTSSLAFGLALLTHNDHPLKAVAQTDSQDTLFGSTVEFKIINYFNQIRNRDGLVEICSTDPTLRLHLNRHSATGYPALHMLATAARHNANGEPIFTEYQQRWQRNYIDTLRILRPRFIVVARHMKYWAVPDLNDSFLQYFPSFDSLLKASYSLDTSLGGYEVYRLRNNPISLAH